MRPLTAGVMKIVMQRQSHKQLLSEVNERKSNNEDVVIFRSTVISRRDVKAF